MLLPIESTKKVFTFQWNAFKKAWKEKNTDWAIYWTLGSFLKPLATINRPKSPIFLGYFCEGVKIGHFLVKSFLGNFYRHLAIFVSGQTGYFWLNMLWLKYNLQFWAKNVDHFWDYFCSICISCLFLEQMASIIGEEKLCPFLIFCVRPQVSLTAPNRDHFARVSLMVFWMQLPKLKN